MQPRQYPEIGQLFVYLAVFYPIYFIVTNSLGQIKDLSLVQRGWINAIATFVLFLLMPFGLCHASASIDPFHLSARHFTNSTLVSHSRNLVARK